MSYPPTFDPMVFHAKLRMHIDRIADKIGSTPGGVFGRDAYGQLETSVGRVTRKSFDTFVVSYETYIKRTDLAELKWEFDVYVRETAAMPSARESALVPARSLKLVEASAVLKSSCHVDDMTKLGLATEEGLNDFVADVLLKLAYQRRYREVIDIGQAAVEFSLRAPSKMGFQRDSPAQHAALAQLALTLGWTGVQCRSGALVLWARDIAAKIRGADPFCQSVLHHIAGYLSGRDAGAEHALKARTALHAGRPYYAVSPNYRRSLDASALRKAYIERGVPLDARLTERTGKPTIRDALDENIEQAMDSDRKGSLVIAHVQKGEAMVRYGEESEAMRSYFDAREVHILEPVANNDAAIAELDRLILAARSKIRSPRPKLRSRRD